MSALETVLLERAAAHARARFVCPDCDGDPACPTCGEPTRGPVLWALMRIVRSWARWSQ